tara:strand:+ start:336 stop:533 length:198 start_codon:yes stop_codon:yes gene_type:complete
MISLKTFHYFFITVSVLITAYYGIFEIIDPSIPGNISNILSAISFLISAGLAYYGINVYNKLKEI